MNIDIFSHLLKLEVEEGLVAAAGHWEAALPLNPLHPTHVYHTAYEASLICCSCMRKKDYTGAAGHWEAALALNPLNPDGWFALGFACLKAGDSPRAVQVRKLTDEFSFQEKSSMRGP